MTFNVKDGLPYCSFGLQGHIGCQVKELPCMPSFNFSRPDNIGSFIHDYKYIIVANVALIIATFPSYYLMIITIKMFFKCYFFIRELIRQRVQCMCTTDILTTYGVK